MRDFLRTLIAVDTRVLVTVGIQLHLRVMDINYTKPYPFYVEVNNGDMPKTYVGVGLLFLLLHIG